MLNFTEKLLENCFIFDFQLGVLFRKIEFNTYNEVPKCKRIFVFKGYSEDYIHYLPKILERGPDDGSAPLSVPIPERSVLLVEKKRALEQMFGAANYQDPQGDKTVW